METEADPYGWRVLAERVVHDGWRRMLVRRYRSPNGAEVEIEVLAGRDAVSIFAVTTDHQVILARQYRHGPGRPLDELPGGMIEYGEDPAEAAARELREETGFVSPDLRLLASGPRGGYFTGVKHVFVAPDCSRITGQDLDHGEEIEVVLTPLPLFLDQLRSMQLTDPGAAYRGLDALGLLPG